MFSEKYGYVELKEIQYENISQELRNRIWNLFYQTEIKEDGIPNAVMDRFYPTKDMHTMYVCEVLKCLEK